MTCHVGRHRVGAVGGDGVGGRGADEGCRRNVVHVQAAIGLALGHALGHDAGSGAVSNRQAVGDQEDDVLGLGLFRRAIDVPGDALGLAAGGNFNLVVAGFCKRHAAQDDGRTEDLVLVLFFGDEFDFLAESCLVILAVDGDLDVFRLYDFIELDFEIERRAGQDRRAIERVDFGSLSGAGENGRSDQGGKEFAHIPLTDM
ncbi:hypothetical protein D3C80_1189330 [compost metagenome]